MFFVGWGRRRGEDDNAGDAKVGDDDNDVMMMITIMGHQYDTRAARNLEVFWMMKGPVRRAIVTVSKYSSMLSLLQSACHARVHTESIVGRRQTSNWVGQTHGQFISKGCARYKSHCTFRRHHCESSFSLACRDGPLLAHYCFNTPEATETQQVEKFSPCQKVSDPE